MTIEYSGKVFGLFNTIINRKQIANIEDRGGKVYRFPVFDIVREPIDKRMKGLVQNITDFDWIFFIDVYTVDAFLAILDMYDVNPFDLDDIFVCALGESVADRLRFVQLHSDVIPAKKNARVILSCVKNYMSDSDGLDKSRALIVKGKGGESEIVNLLQENYSDLEELEVYGTQGISDAELVKINTLLKGGAVDRFLFCSVEDVQIFSQVIYPETLVHALEGIEVLATDEMTLQTLNENGLERSYQW